MVKRFKNPTQPPDLRDAKSVILVRIGGNQVIRGGNATDNYVNDANVKTVIESVHARGFGNSIDTSTSHGIIVEGSPLACKTTREAYANIYGPTVGDKIRKIIRDGMGKASGYSASDCLDTVITNALIIDYTRIFKADIGTDNQEKDEKQSPKRQNRTRNGKDCERQSQIEAG
ncbi:urease isoform X1, partial [Tanacetum coccineum]